MVLYTMLVDGIVLHNCNFVWGCLVDFEIANVTVTSYPVGVKQIVTFSAHLFEQIWLGVKNFLKKTIAGEGNKCHGNIILHTN